jgi:hypothetical protein
LAARQFGFLTRGRQEYLVLSREQWNGGGGW